MKNKIGKVITLAIFLISFLLMLIPIAYAQTPTPPTRDSLIQAIQLRAQKDVELGAAPQSPSDLAVLFGEQAAAVSMSMNEVKDIYDVAYKAATPVKSPWEDLLKPQGGWIFLIVGALLVILGNIAKDYLIALLKKLAEATYQRLARFRPFWMIALRRYRKSLEATYRELKIPFRAGRPLPMQDVYVPVRVDGGDKQQVDAYQIIQKQKRLVVLGDPGSGKTMFLRHVALTYATQGLYDFPGHPVPVYLELNRIENAGNSLMTALAKTLENHNFPSAEGFIRSALESGLLIILLDGLDEVNAPARPVLVEQIKDVWQKYPDNRIIVTCRKAVYQGELDTWIDQKLEIIEFSDQQIQRFMISWQKDMPAEKSIEHFSRSLQERPQIMALARNPLLLTMVAYLYTDTEFALPHSRSEFYSRSTDLLLDQWKLERNRYKATHKRAVLQRLALFNQSQAGKTGERRTLELADVLREIRNVLPDLVLKTEDAQPLLDEIVHRSGLILAIDGGTRYQFTHLTLQEYFAARALEADQKKLLDFYCASPDAWHEVVRLWCALEHDCTAMLKELHALDPVMAFECLSDAQQVDNVYADELMQNLRPCLHEALINDSLASAFALLAADPRKRGKTWFEYLEKNLNDKTKRKRMAACAVLARTNVPQAAGPLVKLAATDSDVIPFLIQLGNLAVPALVQPAQIGELWAIDALVDIGTPQGVLTAVRFLQPLLWSDEPKAYHAAWRLAALLPYPGIEDTLKKVELDPEQYKADQIKWIWAPFSDNKIILGIVGRIAHLLHITSKSSLRPKRLLPDVRLNLPLQTILNSQEISKIRVSKKWKTIIEELKNRHPSIDDWRNQFKPLIYDFSTTWPVKALKLMWLLLVSINILGIIEQVGQHSIKLGFESIVAIITSIVLLVCTIAILKRSPTYNDFEVILLLIFILSGLGVTGTIVSALMLNWTVGIIGVIIFVLVVGLVMSRFYIADKNKKTLLVGVIVSSIVIGILIGCYIGYVVGGLIGGTMGTILSAGQVGIFIIVLVRVSRHQSTRGIASLLIVFIPLAFILLFFPLRFLDNLAGLSAVIVFWLTWLGECIILFFSSQHIHNRRRNPFHGLFEPWKV